MNDVQQACYMNGPGEIKATGKRQRRLTLFRKCTLAGIAAKGSRDTVRARLCTVSRRRATGTGNGSYRIGSSPGRSESPLVRGKETKLSQTGELCVRNSLLFGETLLFVLGSMEHMGPELFKGQRRIHSERARSKDVGLWRC